jgi:hypothetical protein
MKSLDKMHGVYEVPAYELVPAPNSEEKKHLITGITKIITTWIQQLSPLPTAVSLSK